MKDHTEMSPEELGQTEHEYCRCQINSFWHRGRGEADEEAIEWLMYQRQLASEPLREQLAAATVCALNDDGEPLASVTQLKQRQLELHRATARRLYALKTAVREAHTVLATIGNPGTTVTYATGVLASALSPVSDPRDEQLRRLKDAAREYLSSVDGSSELGEEETRDALKRALKETL